jgi:ribosome biogenesis GTPase
LPPPAMPSPATPSPATPSPATPSPASPPSDQRASADLAALGYDRGPWPALLTDLDPDAEHARVVRADRGAATAVTAGGSRRVTWLPATAPPVTGDWVALRGDAVVGIAPRRTAITRPGHHVGYRTDGGDQVLAANPDVVGVVVPLATELNVRRLERGLIMAYESGATPVVLLTMADLCEDLHVVVAAAAAAAPGVDVSAVSTVTGAGLDPLAARLAPGLTLVLLGASGAGKSSLINALVGADVLATGARRSGDGKGRHTTTHRELVILPTGGAVMDTPGLRTLSLGQVPDGLEQAFPDVEALAAGCRFGDCRHDGEPGCAVAEAVADGALAADRFEGWRRIRAEVENAALRADVARFRAKARTWGKVSREVQRLKRP